MFHISDGLRMYFVVIDAEVHFLKAVPSDTDESPREFFEKKLNQDFLFFPNWEAVGATLLLEYREDRNAARVYVPGEILYDYKMKMKPHVIKTMKERFPKTNLEWNELPEGHFEDIQNYETFGRSEDGKWFPKKAPVERAIFASKTADAQSLGRPGGPCKIIKNIEDASLPDPLKEELVKDIHYGEELDNDEAGKIYDHEVLKLGGDFVSSVNLTHHAQYRMDFRSVTSENLKSAFHEFEKWLKYRKKNPHSMSFEDQDLIQDISSGKVVRFSADRIGLTIVFKMPRPHKAILISVWWNQKPNPKPPKPGECDRFMYGENMPKKALREIVAGLKTASSFLHREACGCGCDGDCGGDCGCDNCSCDPTEGPVEEEGESDQNWYESSQKDTNWYDNSEKDGNWYDGGDKQILSEQSEDLEEDDKTVDARQKRKRQERRRKNRPKGRLNNRRSY